MPAIGSFSAFLHAGSPPPVDSAAVGNAASRANRTQITRALLRLRELILSGEFEPGERLSELPLVERIGVSRTPLRLALAALEHEGLLRGLPAGGYVVREFTQADMSDAIELRGVLEGTAARFAAERGVSSRELKALRTTNDAIERLLPRTDYESFVSYVDLNEEFHAKLLELARSPMLERALEGILSLPFASPSAFVLTEALLPESRTILVIAHGHHVGLIEAIERRQGARAESIAREHARIAVRNLEIVTHHREMLAGLPGASLIALATPREPEPV
jgi:GntR family transcriptional regulator, vanillate catabolism transcriptional regulator